MRVNERLAKVVEKIYCEYTDKSYSHINDALRHDYGIYVNDKRVLRLCRKKNIKSTIKYRKPCCTRSAKDPQHIAGNLLARKFHAQRPNEK